MKHSKISLFWRKTAVTEKKMIHSSTSLIHWCYMTMKKITQLYQGKQLNPGKSHLMLIRQVMVYFLN
ncbi:hypothetical protein BY458DRAFT_109358 [Sporodiniella umbellata]|nr:hypothetical protein BY458DRAFT_109358 [Sporodiniella umbellata]